MLEFDIGSLTISFKDLSSSTGLRLRISTRAGHHYSLISYFCRPLTEKRNRRNVPVSPTPVVIHFAELKLNVSKIFFHGNARTYFRRVFIALLTVLADG